MVHLQHSLYFDLTWLTNLFDKTIDEIQTGLSPKKIFRNVTLKKYRKMITGHFKSLRFLVKLLLFFSLALLFTLFFKAKNDFQFSGSSKPSTKRERVDIKLRPSLFEAIIANTTMTLKKTQGATAPSGNVFTHFCSHYDSEDNSQEGEVRDGWKLLQVQAVIRHGDRTPLKFEMYEKHEQAADFCHMDAKTLTILSKTYPHHLLVELDKQLRRREFLPYYSTTECYPGQLTLQGMLQEIRNGLILRSKYMKHNDFYAELSKKIQLFSTQTFRTKQSGSALIKSFYPKYNKAFLKIGYVPTYKFCGTDCFCPYASSLIKSVKIEDKTEKEDKSVLELANSFDLPAKPKLLIDTLIVGWKCKFLDIPCKDGKCPKDAHFDQLLQVYEARERMMNENGATRNGSMLLMQPMLKSIASTMSKVINTPNLANKFILYSTHDLTLRPLLQALHIPDYRWPRFASRIVFELWEDSRGENVVKVLYNGQDVTPLTAFCKEARNRGDRCSHANFQQFVHNGIFQVFDNATTHKQACSKKL